MSTTPLPAAIEKYLASFESTWTDDDSVERVRFVVLDSETTGLDPRTDRLITIGAVAVEAGQIVLADLFEEMIKVAYNSAAVTVHGITRDEAMGGLDEPEAVAAFLEYLRDGVIVGHHIGHDIEMLNRACERHFGMKLANRSIDTMDLALHLKDDGVFGEAELPGFSLDALCALFEIEPWDRHTAGGDAFMTALVFLRLLRLARKAGRRNLGSLTVP
ncbi:MAG: 3'-5' exonuclease, partial [Acidobacteriota bacterium]